MLSPNIFLSHTLRTPHIYIISIFPQCACTSHFYTSLFLVCRTTTLGVLSLAVPLSLSFVCVCCCCSHEIMSVFSQSIGPFHLVRIVLFRRSLFFLSRVSFSCFLPTYSMSWAKFHGEVMWSDDWKNFGEKKPKKECQDLLAINGSSEWYPKDERKENLFHHVKEKSEDKTFGTARRKVLVRKNTRKKNRCSYKWKNHLIIRKFGNNNLWMLKIRYSSKASCIRSWFVRG